jgi:hypothetical protein
MKRHEKKYSVHPKFKGCLVGVKNPPFARKQKGVFMLDDTLSQKEMDYLFDVCNLKNCIIESVQTIEKED